LSILFALICGYGIIIANYWLALVFFALAAAMDFIDGAVARKKNLATKKGAYWDTISDRYVEAIILFALLFAELPEFYLPISAWIFLAIFGSTMTTYAKAAAKEKGLSETELKGGLMSRAERLIVMLFALTILIIGFDFVATIVIVILAIFSNIAAIQRIVKALV
jgi:phosphatidylglycerophosphate synthase